MVPEIVVAHATPAPHQTRGDGGFVRHLLSELNPLQYLPVVGTLYRAITGDTIPERARIVGSMVVSGLMGGPIGLAMNVASLAVEKATGLDPDRIGTALLADLGIGGATATTPMSTSTSAPPAAARPTTPWSPTQLAAYGITTAPDGTLHRGALSGSDVLNELELARTA